MRAIVGFIEKISDFFGEIAMYLVPTVVVIGFLNVVARYTFNTLNAKLPRANLFIETQWHLYSLIFLLSFAYILKNQINVRVDFWFAEQSIQRKAWIDFIGHIVFLLPFCMLALYMIWPALLTSWGKLPASTGIFPNESWGTWELSPDPDGIPRAPIKTALLFGFFLLLLQTIAELLKLIATLRGDMHYAEQEAPIRIE